MSDASLHPDMLMNRVFAETGLTAAKQLHDIIRRPARMAHPSPAELRAARYGISGIAFVAHGARFQRIEPASRARPHPATESMQTARAPTRGFSAARNQANRCFASRVHRAHARALAFHLHFRSPAQ